MEPATNIITSSWKKYSVYVVGFLVAVAVYIWISAPLVVTVSGVGEVSAKAESATLTLTISSNKENPQLAISAVKATSQKIKETLATAGISKGDISESQIEAVPASAVVAGATGYQATLSMGVKTSMVNNLDGLTNNLYSLGAVVVTQPVLSVGDISTLEKDAYNLAIKDAKKKASSMALSNLKFIKKIILIEQSQTQPTSTVTTKADVAAQVEKNLSPDDGLIKIAKAVSISYKMW